MRRRLAMLRVTTFIAVALGILMVGELSQAVAEGWLNAEEEAMVAQVNQHRSSHRMKSLKINAGLKMVARRQAQRMVMKGKIYHNPDLQDEADKAVPDWMLLGENVGVGPDEPSVQEAFLDSPPHHHNIDTKSFNIIGLGAMAADDGAMYFTQNFAQSDAAVAKASSNKSSSSSANQKPTNKSKPPIVMAEQKSKKSSANPKPKPSASKAATPKPKPQASGPKPKPTPSATEAPRSQSSSQDVTLIGGIAAMVGEALSKIGGALKFW